MLTQIGLIVAILAAAGFLAWALIERARRSTQQVEQDHAARQIEQGHAALDRANQQQAVLETEIKSLTEKLSQANQRIAALESAARERQEAFEAARKALVETFDAHAAKALRISTDEFLKSATKDFDVRRKSIDEMIKPVRESLANYEKKLEGIEQHRRESTTQLKQQLEFLNREATNLKLETGQLVQALRTPDVRGRWGELQLRRVVELAGMSPYCDFDEQVSMNTGDRIQRPDLVVNLPNGRRIIVDAKVPLQAYLDALDAPDREQQRACMVRHARHVRDQAKLLSEKTYWSKLEQTPDFVVMFIPGEIFLSEALRTDPSILEFALERDVIPTTPSSLIALLKAIEYGWQQEQLAASARQIVEAGRELHSRLGVILTHAGELGKKLDGAVDAYNRFNASLNTRLIPQVRTLETLHCASNKQINEIAPVVQQCTPLLGSDSDEPAPAPGADEPPTVNVQRHEAQNISRR